ncbi:MAG: hypothetical protein ACK4GR_00995 [bacterium]
MKVSTIQKIIKYTFEIDFSEIDNSLEHSLLPFNDAYIMSKVTEKIEQQGYAKITGTFANLPINLLIKPITPDFFSVRGEIGENEIKETIIASPSYRPQPDLKKHFLTDNTWNEDYMIRSDYKENHNQEGSMYLETIFGFNQFTSQNTITFKNNEYLYKVKKDPTGEKEKVSATFLSYLSKYPEKKVETTLSLEIDKNLQVRGEIKQNNKKWVINYKIR